MRTFPSTRPSRPALSNIIIKYYINLSWTLTAEILASTMLSGTMFLKKIYTGFM